MIKGILFAAFIVALAICIGLAIYFIIKYRKSAEYLEERLLDARKKYKDQLMFATKEEKEKAEKEYELVCENLRAENKVKGLFGVITSICMAIVLTGLVITIPGSFHQVEAGTYAVVKELGKIVDVKQPGTHFDFYMTKHYEIYDATVQQVKINTQAYSKDGQTMDLEVYLQYQIQLDKLVIRDNDGNIIQTEGIAGKYITLDSLQARIETQCIEKTKAVMSSAEAMTIIQDRAKYSEDVSSTVREAIGPDYYVNVQDVVLTNIDFTDEFEKSVEDKVVAEQQKTAAETKANAEAEVARIKAEAEKTVAEIEAQKKIIEAEADAEVVRITAEAEARAVIEKIVQLARTVGFNVIETETGYIIEFDAIHTAEMFKSIVEEYLEYLAYLEQWNGELPQVLAGDDSISIIIPGE